MKNRYLVVIVVILLLSVVGSQQAQDGKAHIPIDEQTFLVYRRYYFIERLDKTIQLLAKMYQEVNHMQAMLTEQAVNFKDLLPQHECEHLGHKLIKRSIAYIQQTRSLKPLFLVWDSFKSYKFLHDDLFVDDFSKEIFIITRNTINHLQRCQPNGRLKHSCMQHALIAYKLGDLLDDIDVMRQYLCGCTRKTSSREQTDRSLDVSDLHLSVNTDEVAFRFYCTKRIEKAVSFLLALPSQELHIPNKVDCLFRHGALLKEVHVHKSFAKLWEDVEQYRYIDNDQFMRDFLSYMLALLLHKQQSIIAQRSLSSEEIATIHEQIENIPIEELLHTIDVVITNINQIHQHYQKSGLTIVQWLKHYWWVPPIVFSSFLLKAIQHYYVHA